MTQVSEIIRDAFRETNILPLGAAPNSAQSDEALRLLNRLISSLYGTDAGELLTDWPLGRYGVDDDRQVVMFSGNLLTAGHPHLNRRLIATNEDARTIFLSQKPQDGSRMAFVDPYARASQAPVTIDGNGRPIEGADSVVMNVDGESRTWFYRADLGAWVRLTDLTETDLLPFPAEFDTFFTISLAIRINPRYGRDLDDQSAAVFQRDRRSFINRYLQSLPMQQNPILSWPFMSLQSYDRYMTGTSNNFNKGTFR